MSFLEQCDVVRLRKVRLLQNVAMDRDLQSISWSLLLTWTQSPRLLFDEYSFTVPGHTPFQSASTTGVGVSQVHCR